IRDFHVTGVQTCCSSDLFDHISLISGMRKALQDSQFSLYYQPKIELQTNRICGVEALLRWNHPEQGFISPATFIPLAESSGLIRSEERCVGKGWSVSSGD